MSRIPATHLREAHILGLRRSRGHIDGIVLEHDQCVEQLADTGELLDLRQPQMLMTDQPRLTVLNLLEQITE